MVNQTMQLVKDDAAMESIIAKVMELQNKENANIPLYEKQLTSGLIFVFYAEYHFIRGNLNPKTSAIDNDFSGDEQWNVRRF